MSIELLRFDLPISVADWSPIDDAVMGGVSSSRMRHDPQGYAVFEGMVSLERNGGFASVRSQPAKLDLPGTVALLLEVWGDGKRYKLNLRTDDAFDGANYQARFHPPAQSWAWMRIALRDFQPTFRGRSLADAPTLDPARVRRIGLMIADRQAGPFSLAIRSIAVE